MTASWSAFAVPLGIAVAGNIAYHLASKSVPQSLSPFAVLAFVYLIASISAAALSVANTPSGLGQIASIARQPLVYLLAGAVLAIELGFLLAYRAGAPVSISSLTVNATVALVLAGIGIVAFREPFSWRVGFGVLLTLAGVILITTAPTASAK